MRTRDAVLALMAATMAMFSAVTWAAGLAWYALLPPLLGLAALGVLWVHMAHDPKVLLVAEPRGTMAGNRLEEALDEAGYMAVRCPGPSARKGGCPVLSGGDCPIHWKTSAAMAFESAPCDRGLGIPVVSMAGWSDPATAGRAVEVMESRIAV